ncbi:Ribosomal RNA small subunit methyltransferase D [Carbonactinospora thermoautotrophica]|uniref:Ribosomal RNA small subunit methyltransferase D n=2 Tax=Carbonactinospora thermoautotrophica TaxID=1469144 RepID=A0A132MP47_9ACTN|nr:16S rRNA (guanine(966)-N(2))-methyltransferase RsmD [Carbonactinospora thermoautotrophica]KWW99644.1 Ribosomal RNA small subunit methyltransferase D [Carbonactinospora thermoautotrophica]
MTRVIAGAARGRRLAVPPGQGTRPTSDRAREGLFSTVEALHGPLRGARVADLYAGSGAVGLEALSRGAAHVLLVEADARAARVIRENVRALGLPGAEVRVAKVERLVEEAPGEPYDVVFLDPPYALGDEEVRRVLAGLSRHGWLGTDALVVVERATRGGDFAWPDGYETLRSRRYGEGTLWYGRAARPFNRPEGMQRCDESSAPGRSTR